MSINLPPIAKKIKHTTLIHKQKLVDEYHWLRDKNWPNVKDKEILKYLNAENKYTEKFFKNKKALQNKIYKELISRIKLSDKSTPIKKRNYHYFAETKAKLQYTIHHRINDKDKSEVIFDENKESKNKDYFKLDSLAISPNEQLMAYSFDIAGNEHFHVKVRNLATNKELTDTLKDVLGAVTWDNSSNGFFYRKLDKKWRANKIYYHKLGTKQQNDKLIYHEHDDTFHISITKSTDENYIFIIISSSNNNEILILDPNSPLKLPKLLIKRAKDRLYIVDHFNGYFYIKSNDKGKNFRFFRVKSDSFKPKNYRELIPHNDKIYLINFHLFNHHIIISKKILGLSIIEVYDYDFNKIDQLKFDDESYNASTIFSWKDDDGVIIAYSSLSTPQSTLKYLFKTKKIHVLKEQEIPSGYDKNHYQTKRLFISSTKEKIKIPVSLVYKKSLLKNNGSNPMLLYGYGSYGITVPAGFNSNIISLLDRGFIFAIAHIRGGDDMGYHWYEDAKFLHKKRTFNDFNDVLSFFANSKYSSSKKISISGGSAGGMLVGVTLNEKPDLLNSAIADVPFVDVLNTMLDDKLPLTPGEYKEWGNPTQKKFFDYIKSYSPYENIKKQAYPNIYVLAGLNDPRVTYWEPAKYVAKLRNKKIDNNILILETEMTAGHAGKSGRFNKYKEIAKKYTFLLYGHNIIR